jgi:ABC-type multidrug transport system fused ATPase/permease subunit
LHILRTKLSYIPQESLLTSGSLREALDITGEKDDHELYAAMKQVHLDIAPGSPFSNLDTQVSTGMFKLPILHPVLRLIRSLDAIAGYVACRFYT